jgi:hypothetical protein
MINPGTIIFAIQAGIKLAEQSAVTSLIDHTHEHAGEFCRWETSPETSSSPHAIDYFRDHKELRAPGARHRLGENQRGQGERLPRSHGHPGRQAARRVEHHPAARKRLEQVKCRPGRTSRACNVSSASSRRSALITSRSIPDKLGRNSGTRQVLVSFIRNLDEVNFSESTPRDPPLSRHACLPAHAARQRHAAR